MFTEEDPSGEEINIYVKFSISACNAFGKGVKIRTKVRRIAAKNEKNTAFHQQQTFSGH